MGVQTVKKQCSACPNDTLDALRLSPWVPVFTGTQCWVLVWYYCVLTVTSSEVIKEHFRLNSSQQYYTLYLVWDISQGQRWFNLYLYPLKCGACANVTGDLFPLQIFFRHMYVFWLAKTRANLLGYLSHLHTHIHTYVCTYVHTYIHAFIHTHTHTHTYTHERTFIHIYKHIYIHTCMHKYIHTYIDRV